MPIADKVVDTVRDLDGRRILSAWEPTTLCGPHSTITFFEGRCYGRIGTKTPPPEIEALPPWSEERSRAVRGWYERQAHEAYALIEAAYPEAALGRRVRGEIEVAA